MNIAGFTGIAKAASMHDLIIKNNDEYMVWGDARQMFSQKSFERLCKEGYATSLEKPFLKDVKEGDIAFVVIDSMFESTMLNKLISHNISLHRFDGMRLYIDDEVNIKRERDGVAKKIIKQVDAMALDILNLNFKSSWSDAYVYMDKYRPLIDLSNAELKLKYDVCLSALDLLSGESERAWKRKNIFHKEVDEYYDKVHALACQWQIVASTQSYMKNQQILNTIVNNIKEKFFEINVESNLLRNSKHLIQIVSLLNDFNKSNHVDPHSKKTKSVAKKINTSYSSKSRPTLKTDNSILEAFILDEKA